VEAVQLADGRCEFLAVAPLLTADQESRDAEKPNTGFNRGAGPNAASQSAPPAPVAPSPGAAAIDAEQLTLPYAVPS
jgi:hypothetical protein